MNKKRLYIFIGVIALIIVSLVVIFSVVYKLINPSEGETYNDPLSGETLYTPKNRTPETYGSVKEPIYLGFSKLLDVGMTSDDLDMVKYYIFYISKNKNNINEISVDVSSIRHLINPDGSGDTYNFKVVTNRKEKYQAKVVITDNGVTLVLLDDKSKVYFNSDKVDAHD